MLDIKREYRTTKEQYEKIKYILWLEHKKVWTFLRDYIQETINKYEIKNGKINVNQTSIK